ncbi:flippase [Paenimyroides viscosum]|uniref:Flippase n=1 Tax=Paenimyroides viscosum TaxID=2488729 RepID=A0A3P1ANB5_9FLAO|nr:flippase [Paenimyroides viscosum]RRA90385.1 flippase [Paenimyroides viscosum]
MKIRSVKTNYLLSLTRILSTTLIGVITMPYINKILGAVSIGKVEYINSIISYFLLISALGIPVYAVRQIAKHRNDPLALGKNVVEILVILIFTTFLSYLAIFCLIKFTDIFIDYKSLVIILSSSILLTNLGIEWFYQGIEDQLYITVRFVVIRIITLILLFLLVKSADDYLYYAFILVLNAAGSNFFNLLRLRKHVSINKTTFLDLNFKRHLMPALTIFIASISVSLYQIIDTFLLGYLQGDKYVGYYSVANKLMRYVVLFIVTIGAVLLPRLSNLWEVDKNKYFEYLNKSLELILLISLPFVPFFIYSANGIIHFMAGEDFKESILTMQLLSPVCVLVGLAYFFGYLVLYPQNKEKYYTISVTISAILCFFLNFYLINLFKQNGAAIAQVLAELLGIFLIFYFSIKHASLRTFNYKNIKKIIVANLFVGLFGFILFKVDVIELAQISIFYFLTYCIVFFIAYYFLLLLIKERNTLSYTRHYYKLILKK